MLERIVKKCDQKLPDWPLIEQKGANPYVIDAKLACISDSILVRSLERLRFKSRFIRLSALNDSAFNDSAFNDSAFNDSALNDDVVPLN